MDRIRVNTGEKKIEVNDNGDFITINFSDHDFPSRFFAMLDHVELLAKEAEPKEKEIRANFADDNNGLIRALSDLDKDIHRSIMAEVDSLFGDGTCQKVFGDIIPGIELYGDFFNQLLPYIQQFGEERAKRMSKYRASRTGNV